MQDLARHLSAIEKQKIIVVGDLMLDAFVYGEVSRISPEGPIPVMAIREEKTALGGAGNVVANLCALGANPLLFSVIGNDAAAESVLDLMQAYGAETAGLVRDTSRPTIQKQRYVAQGQQLLRVDSEKTHALSPDIESKLWAGIEKAMASAKAIVLSDYGKGVLNKPFLSRVIAAANAAKVPVLVDPKGSDFSIYRGADIVTPNRKELGAASGKSDLKSDEQIVVAAQKVIAECGIKHVVATRSEDGMSIIGAGAPVHIKTQAREVFDVSGAGDTVIATLAAALAAGADLESAARLANVAAGIAVSKTGTSSVRAEEITAALGGAMPTGFLAPVSDWTEAEAMVRAWQAQGLKVGMTCGCFDILHYGHVNYLAQARGQCDRLIVAINHDASVKLLKGPLRPVNDEMARATVMASLGSVDLVVMFGASKASADNTPSELVAKLRPDIFFKGGDYTIEQLPEGKVVLGYGGEVSILKMFEGYSTTSIIEKSSKAS